MVKIRHFCYLLKLHEDLSFTVQNGIPQAFCTDKIPCQTHLMVHDDIDITTRVSCEICTNNSADFRDFPQTKIFMRELKDHADLAHQVNLLHELD